MQVSNDMPVNLVHLRELIDGDMEVERVLFKEFMLAADQAVDALALSVTSNTAEKWRKTAHMLKGIAYNIGARKLGDLCKNAQEHYQDDIHYKQQMHGSIDQEYIQVKAYLEGLMQAAA